MPTLFADLETYSPTPITAGAHRYAEDAEVLLWAWAIDDGPVSVWDLTDNGPMPARLRQALDDPQTMTVWHNGVNFDTVVLRHAMGIEISDERITDTMVIALQHSLPGALAALCEVLNIPTDQAKDKAGKQLIQLFAKPRPKNSKIERATRATHPVEWDRFVSYAGSDVEAMRAVLKRLPKWNCGVDRETELLDRRINRRGIAVDLDLVDAAIRTTDTEKKRLAKAARDMTGGAVSAATQRDALLEHILAEYGVPLPDMTRATLERRVNDPDLPVALRELLAVRLQATTTSTAKYQALARAVSSDGRLRGTLQYCGASRTGRWAGRHVQLQNLPRGTMPAEEVAVGIDAIKDGTADLLVGNVMDLAANAVRGVFVAPPGKRLVISDLSNIEGRVLAWLAGETWKLQAFAAFDRGEGDDLYKLAYARSFGITPAEVTKDQRQVGKVMELALGYQGGVGAFVTFAAAYGLDLDELAERALPALDAEIVAEAESFLDWTRAQKRPRFGLSDQAFIAADALKRAWRTAHPATVRLWASVDEIVRRALVTGEPYRYRALVVDKTSAWLRVRLPSGRCLSYPGARIEADDTITYMGVDQYTRKWQRIRTYAGKLCLAADTLVVTDSGLVPISRVPVGARVWDGSEWVACDGSVCNGERETVAVFGVRMTPDHEVMTIGGWRVASSCEGHYRADARLLDGVALLGLRWKELRLVVQLLGMRWRVSPRRKRVRQAAKAWRHGVVWLHARENNLGQAGDARDVETPRLRRLAQHGRSLPATFTSGVGELWRSGHNCLRRMAGFVRGVLAGHGAVLLVGLDAGACGQLERVLGGKLPMGDLPRTGEQQAAHRVRSSGARTDSRVGLRGAIRARLVDVVLPTQPGVDAPGAIGPGRLSESVFDVVNAGPRSRFTVIGQDGLPLIVHNCENVTQAVARDVMAWNMPKAEATGFATVMTVHDELITEAPARPEFTAERLSDLLATVPSWATGLPLAAGGFTAQRYRKD